jgi:hypothetical protein
LSFVRPALLAGVVLSLGISSGRARAGDPPPAPAPEPAPLAAERARDAERPLLVRPFFAISWIYLESSLLALHYDPTTSFGASVGWRRLKLTVSKTVKLVTDEPYDDGTTLSTHELALSLSGSLPVGGRELVLTPFYSRASGFQVEIDTSVDPHGNPGGDIIKRQDLTLQSFGLDALYCLNPRFSYDDRFVELKPREHSSATFLVRASLGRVSMSTDGRPLNAQTYLGPESELARTAGFDANYAGAAAGGAFQLLPLGHLAINGMLTVGGTLSNAHATLSDGTRPSQLSLRPTFSSNLGLGWVGYLIHTGLIYYYNNEAIAIGDETVSVRRLALLLYLGLRV